MATLTAQTVASSGTDMTFVAAAAGGDLSPVGPDYTLFFKNGDASSKTVTFVTPNTVDGLAIADRTVTVAAGVTTAIPLRLDLYKDPTDGLAHITYSAVTSCTVCVLRIP